MSLPAHLQLNLHMADGPRANQLAMQKAAESGSGWVSVRNTHHYGIAGAYSLAALDKDMIGISMTNSSAVVAPLFGKQRFLGTNPIAIAFPVAAIWRHVPAVTPS